MNLALWIAGRKWVAAYLAWPKRDEKNGDDDDDDEEDKKVVNSPIALHRY